ncbi:hypothetical protein [Desulfovibrio inopinatus]|uniref:hypothetical protein n=1 Tax=Desulfovibrio inopinatus TaxID=102109 RepID=UPI00040584CF|nr:hypothetical protein [Desulfovibrio inopinatus]
MTHDQLVALLGITKELTANAPAELHRTLAGEIAYSREFFFDHPLLLDLQDDVLPFLYEDPGHGVEHSKKVAIDASALVLKEGTDKFPPSTVRHLAFLAQVAGLLHNVCRQDKLQTDKCSDLALILLREKFLDENDRAIIFDAIAFNEADIESYSEAPESMLVRNALHDADMLRWGYDPFSTSLWELYGTSFVPQDEVLAALDKSIELNMSNIDAFLTPTARQFGADVLRFGIHIAQELKKHVATLQSD